MANKVLMGFSDLYIGTYTVDPDDGTVTMGSPYHQAGAVGFSPSESSDRNDFYADNIAYYTTFGAGVVEGDLTVAMFDDAFKMQFLGYVTLDDGGLAQIKNPTKPNIYMAFEVQGDAEGRRVIFYNGTLGEIVREYNTIEDTVTPQTESVPVSFAGDNETGIKMVVYKESDAGYATLFTNPPAPTLPSA